mgnify:CR=1 FL=1
MVVELLFNPFIVKKKPWQMFAAGFLYTFVALIISLLVFKEIAGILTIFLIVISCLPLLFTTIKNEEELDMKSTKEWILLKEHTKVLLFLIALFLGITFALTLIYLFFPQSLVDNIFKLQMEAIGRVNSTVQADVTGNITKLDIFVKIIFNNFKVLFFCLIFSLLYGTGAIFILAWNASVIATAMGNLIKLELARTASMVGFSQLSSYLGVASFAFFRYMTHGILEIAAYFIAGLAGGIISVALIKHNLQEDRVLIDSLDLIIISIGLIVVAGIVEVYVTPVFFY